MHEHLNGLLQKEMTRKEFMATLGFGAATLMGFGTIIKIMNGKPFARERQVDTGYGASVYGGVKPR